MTTEVSEKLYTVEEFLNLEWPDDDDNEYELIGGRIVARQGKLYPQFFSVKDELDGGEVLPGFKLEVNALFKK